LGYLDRKLALKRYALPLLLSLSANACRDRAKPAHRTEPWLAQPSSSGASRSSSPRNYHFATDSRVSFSLQGKRGKVSGSAPVSEGSLRLDPIDPTHSSGHAVVDLEGIVVDQSEVPPGVGLGAASPRELALNWLELGPQVPADRRDQYRWARFELSSVEGSIPLTFTSRKPTAVRLSAVGTLLLHGYRAPVEFGLSVTPEAPASGSPSLSIRSTSPLVLPLAPHDISARSSSGVVDAVTSAHTAEWLGKSVRLEFKLLAVPDEKP
jgi:hypothetical protein